MSDVLGFDEALALCRDRVESHQNGNPVTVVAVAGGSGAGKSYFAAALQDLAGGKSLSMDHYYRGKPAVTDDNFDCPASLDLNLLAEHLLLLRQGREINRPCYEYARSVRTGYEQFLPAPVIVVDGLFPWTGPLKDASDLKVFIEADEAICLERRLKRDAAERDIPAGQVLSRWHETVVPMYRQWVLPLRASADLVVCNNPAPQG